MTVFIADAQRGVWLIDDIDITYTNGKPRVALWTERLS